MLGERVIALVEADEGSGVGSEELIAFTKERLARYKAPKQVLRVPTIRRAPNGKADYAWASAYAASACGDRRTGRSQEVEQR